MICVLSYWLKLKWLLLILKRRSRYETRKNNKEWRNLKIVNFVQKCVHCSKHFLDLLQKCHHIFSYMEKYYVL